MVGPNKEGGGEEIKLTRKMKPDFFNLIMVQND